MLTKHGKERVIAPSLGKQCGAIVEQTDQFDTDQLGTFTGDVPRLMSQRDAAREKAILATTLTGLKLGLGSEGSSAVDPYLGPTPRALAQWLRYRYRWFHRASSVDRR